MPEEDEGTDCSGIRRAGTCSHRSFSAILKEENQLLSLHLPRKLLQSFHQWAGACCAQGFDVSRQEKLFPSGTQQLSHTQAPPTPVSQITLLCSFKVSHSSNFLRGG